MKVDRESTESELAIDLDAEARFRAGFEEFTGPANPEETILFLLPKRQPYRQDMLDILEEIRKEVEDGTIQELGLVALSKGENRVRWSGTDSAPRMAAVMLRAGMERLGFKLEE